MKFEELSIDLLFLHYIRAWRRWGCRDSGGFRREQEIKVIEAAS